MTAQRVLPWDVVPGGITHGQLWLNVTFAKSVLRLPFRVLTKG